MIDSWEEAQTKSKKRYGILLVPVVMLALGGIIYLNNNGDKESSGKDSESIIDDSLDISGDSLSRDLLKSNGEKNNQEQVGMLDAKIAKSIAITNIRHGLNDKKSSEILVSLRLYYKDEKFEKDILFKRDEIKFTVQKIMMKKKLEDINVEHLRKELKDEIEILLGSGKLKDIEFTDFKPVELL